MRLGSEYRTDLEHPLENRRPRLLIKLRRLSQIRFTVEILDLEKVRSSLGGRRKNFRRFDFDELFFSAGLIVSGKQQGIELEYRLYFRMPERDGTIVE